MYHYHVCVCVCDATCYWHPACQARGHTCVLAPYEEGRVEVGADGGETEEDKEEGKCDVGKLGVLPMC